jgi:hypothetical protein
MPRQVATRFRGHEVNLLRVHWGAMRRNPASSSVRVRQ